MSDPTLDEEFMSSEFEDADFEQPTSLSAFGPILESLAADLEFFTNTMKAQMRQRLETLRAQEAEALLRIEQLEALVNAEAATPETKLQLLLTLEHLHAVRLDLADTSSALQEVSLDNHAPLEANFDMQGTTVSVDSRELNN